MPWIKKGVVFRNKGYAQVPTPYVMEDRIRVYYAQRFAGKSFISYFDLALDLKTILVDAYGRSMTLGAPGAFDCDGVMPSCVIRKGDELWMYYLGWQELTGKARYHNEIGLAISIDDGKTFRREYTGPIIGRSKDEPGMAIMPFVMYKNWFRMWYSVGTGWHLIDGKYEPTYGIRYAESTDGVNWDKHKGEVVDCVPYEAQCRPAVVVDGDEYKMWFSRRDSNDYRGGKGSYAMGYGESRDGKHFYRNDDAAGISIGAEGEFDSQMICYPAVCDVEGKRVMFYNGNGFGQTGIGLAVWEN